MYLFIYLLGVFVSFSIIICIIIIILSIRSNKRDMCVQFPSVNNYTNTCIWDWLHTIGHIYLRVGVETR